MLQRSIPPSSHSFSTEAELLKKKRQPLEDAQRSSYAGTTTSTKEYDDDDDGFVDVNRQSEDHPANQAAHAAASSSSSSTAAAGAADEPETPNPEGRTRMNSSLLSSRAPVILTSKTAFSSIHKKRLEGDASTSG